jgi:hypothetical protein
VPGPFWYKDAALQDYQFHPISRPKQADTAQSVLCTPDMTYATMAAAMYTIREVPHNTAAAAGKCPCVTSFRPHSS